MFVCSLSPPRSFDGSSPNLVGVCRLTSHLPLRGSFSKRSTGHFHFPLYYIGASLTPHSCKRRLLLCWLCCSLIRRLLLLHLNGICRWTSQLLLRGSFSKRSTGQTGQRVTFTFTILYMIAVDARLTPPRCKKHTGSMGRRVNGSTGQRVKRVNGSLSLSLYYI